MIISVKTEKLVPGMFIDLTKSWIENPFWKTQFEITSKEQIKMLLEAGIKVVTIDTGKSKVSIEGLKEMGILNTEVYTMLEKEEETPPSEVSDAEKVQEYSMLIKDAETSKWEPEKFMTPAVLQAFGDKTLPPAKKAKVIYVYSLEMMKHLFDNPAPNVIKATKEGITIVTNRILSDEATASNLIKMVSHDYSTYTHSVNVGIKSLLLAKEIYGTTKKHDMFELAAGFFLHDIGKIRIDPKVLYKEGKLTKEEFALIATHPYEGYKILNELNQLSTEVWIVAMQHHERQDGTGYPCGLKSKKIHPYARICCITDVFDALTAKRPHKKQQTPVVQALTIMKNEMLPHFNVELFGKFLMLFRQK